VFHIHERWLRRGRSDVVSQQKIPVAEKGKEATSLGWERVSSPEAQVKTKQ
jgi:hypothetical protein